MVTPDRNEQHLYYAILQMIAPIMWLVSGLVVVIGLGPFLGRDSGFMLLTGLIYAWLVVDTDSKLHPFMLVAFGVLFDGVTGGILGTSSLIWGGLGCVMRSDYRHWFVWSSVWVNWAIAAAVQMVVAVLCWILMSLLEGRLFSFILMGRTWLLAWLAWPIMAWGAALIRAWLEPAG